MSRVVRLHDAMVAAYEHCVRLVSVMLLGAVLIGITKKVMEQGEAVSVYQSGIHLVEGLAKELASY